MSVSQCLLSVYISEFVSECVCLSLSVCVPLEFCLSNCVWGFVLCVCLLGYVCLTFFYVSVCVCLICLCRERVCFSVCITHVCLKYASVRVRKCTGLVPSLISLFFWHMGSFDVSCAGALGPQMLPAITQSSIKS